MAKSQYFVNVPFKDSLPNQKVHFIFFIETPTVSYRFYLYFIYIYIYIYIYILTALSEFSEIQIS